MARLSPSQGLEGKQAFASPKVKKVMARGWTRTPSVFPVLKPIVLTSPSNHRSNSTHNPRNLPRVPIRLQTPLTIADPIP
ncbi:hypothetical protein BT63DRAFT_283594 [Microthyrium microscopicum]|uniref:Uncharacterized protein n=1 Tax=Microthyrium microscopicum TaxID=703497 RepID=A0A6A6UC74_9PEZI|nr:hypothetical protein BT63DRAFT_283594 [Microthyrium microscopicum]